MPPVALTIAGSDPSGGAGIQADLKTFHQFGVYGEAVVTLLTVQNSVRVSRVEVMPISLVLEQIAAVLEDIPPAAAKTGALGSAEMVRAVARAAARCCRRRPPPPFARSCCRAGRSSRPTCPRRKRSPA
jgi:hydroxymethylpyrimidine/phosphomethylpyrimidine kinase